MARKLAAMPKDKFEAETLARELLKLVRNIKTVGSSTGQDSDLHIAVGNRERRAA